MKLSELKELAEKAHKGKWSEKDTSPNSGMVFSHDKIICKIHQTSGLDIKNQKFIAASNPQTVLELIERIEKLSEALKIAKYEFEILDYFLPDLSLKALSQYGADVELK